MLLVRFISSLLCAVCLTACHSPRPSAPETWDMSQEQADSAHFAAHHHYTENFNFEVVNDSLCIQTQAPNELLAAAPSDSLTIRRGEQLVVADILTLPYEHSDTVWVKVAKDQYTMGWIEERDLLHAVVPNTPVSKFIHLFSSRSMLICLALVATALLGFSYNSVKRKHWQCVHFDDVPSIFPTLFAVIFSTTAAVYGSLQAFAPAQWQHFYYNPSLNPFGQPPLLALFLLGLWSIVICGLAMIDDLRRKTEPIQAINYLLTLGGICVLLYLVFTLSVRFYIGYLLLAAYWYFAFYTYWTKQAYLYICGHCGAKLKKLGSCPSCGAFNEK